MSFSYATRRALRDGVHELLVRGGAAVGVATGLLWALERPAPVTSAACKHSSTGSDIGRCFNQTLLATALPYIVAMAFGMIVGALTGALISKLLLGRQRPAGRPTAARPSVPARDGRWITARYAGSCHHCGASIRAGDRFLHRPRRVLCSACA